MTTAEAIRAQQSLRRALNGPRSVHGLRADYVSGLIELDEFEARVENAMLREEEARQAATRWDCERDGHLYTFGQPACRYCAEPYG